MGACSIQPRKQKSFPSAVRLIRNRSRSSLSATAASSAPTVADGSSPFLSSLPPNIRSKLRLATETHILDLSATQLVSLPCGLDAAPGLISLDLSNNALDHEVFSLLISTSLGTLVLSRNAIERLPAELFTALPNLQTLMLSRNEITSLPSHLPIEALPRLALLDLSCNSIAVLPDNLHILQHLRTLSLAANRLTALPPNFGQLHLLTLDLAANRLTTLPPAFAQNLGASLKTLNLARNEIVEIPESLLELTALTSLDLSFNHIAQLPDAGLAALSALRTVNLQRNDIAQFPEGLCHLPELCTIDLSFNNLSIIDSPALVNLSESLITLNLQNNRLLQLAPAFYQLTLLGTLDLSNNRLGNEVLNPLSQLSFLSSVNLSGNPVSALPPDFGDVSFLTTGRFSQVAFTTVPSSLCSIGFLKTLDLSFSRIRSVPEEIEQLVQLEQLNLSHNQIDVLPDAIGSLKNLVKLNLAFNHITTLPSEIGAGLQALETLILSHNGLMALPSSISLMTSLRCLHLSGNTLHSVTKNDPLVRNMTAHRSNSDCDQHQQLSPKTNGVADNTVATVTTTPTQAHRSNSDAACESFWSCLAPLGRTLQHLYVAASSLELPPEVLPQLVELRHLDLSSNKLACLSPTDVASLSKLSSLVLSNNQLASLPTELASLPELAVVTVDNNRLSSLPTLHARTHCSVIANPIDSPGDLNSVQFIVSPTALAASSSVDTEMTPSLGRLLEPVGFSGMTGLRPRMEDSVFVHSYAKNEILVGLFDGHGGSLASHISAQSLHRVFSTHLAQHESPPSVVESTDEFVVEEERVYEGGRLPFDGTNPALLAHDLTARALQQTCESLDACISASGVAGGTTALLAYRSEQFLYVANVGDSRAVLCRASTAVPLSVDHSPTLLREQRRLESLPGGYVIQGRVRGSLTLTRALGDAQLRPWISPIPDITRVQITPEDQFLLLACDGFWDVFTNDEAIALAVRLLESTSSPALAALALRDAAFARESTDNITVCVLHLSDA